MDVEGRPDERKSKTLSRPESILTVALRKIIDPGFTPKRQLTEWLQKAIPARRVRDVRDRHPQWRRP